MSSAVLALKKKVLIAFKAQMLKTGRTDSYSMLTTVTYFIFIWSLFPGKVTNVWGGEEGGRGKGNKGGWEGGR